MPGHVMGDDAEARGDLGVVEERAPLPPVGTRCVQAQQRDARARLLEVDAMRASFDVEMDVAADDGLDADGHERLRGVARRALK